MKKLLYWFGKNRENHPWRSSKEAYGIWISEIMLQQTTIAAVRDYYTAWMKRFPTINSLAQASEQEVLRQWEGLGYYSRARNIHKSAQVLDAAGTELPKDYKELLKLPGIGPYTAAAISSIAFGLPHPVIDGNIKRILCRIFLWPKWNKERETQASACLDKWIKPGPAGDFNEAMMELGQKICTKSSPQCGQCPFNSLCLAHKENRQNEIPEATSSRQIIKKTCLIICVHHNHILMTEKKQGLLKGLWVFPALQGHELSPVLEWLKKHDADFKGPLVLKIQNHLYTKYKDQLLPLVFRLESTISLNEEKGCWIPLDKIGDFPMASVYRKIVGELEKCLEKKNTRFICLP
ncbi:MAG: A/G-specific adenine glycosylase [Spirochaetales bacterium]|nr:A/G-specific adenine glycosylase [Spirochaetales bacterium]